VRTRRPPLVALTAAVLLVACGAADEDPDVTAPDQATTDDAATDEAAADDAEPAPAPSPPDADGGSDLDAAVDDAVADLTASTGVDAAEVEVRTAAQVTWSDGSLGCPEPGMMYTQALVPGYRIVLAVDGTEVAYHGAEGAPPARCDDPQPPSDPGS
jgi:hypothetical protein